MLKNKSGIKKKVLVLSMCFVLVFSVNMIYISKIIATTTNDKLADAKKEEEENKKKQDAVNSQISQNTKDLLELDKEVSKYNTELGELQVKLNAVNEKVKTYENDLQNAAQNYNAAEELYQTRLRAIYENGLPSVIDILFTSDGISDFFSKMNVYNSILDYDKTLIGNMKDQKEYTDNIKKDIEIQKLQLEQLTYDMDKSTKALETAQANKKTKVNQLKKSKSELEKTGKELAKQIEDLNAKILEEIRQREENNNQFSGQFYYPVPGFNVITTRFNTAYDPWDTGTSTIHTGCDIAGAGIRGTPIYAVESGKVITANRLTYGYGRYVVIDHGKSVVDGAKYTSLYGHMTDFIVKKGDFVTRGQVIGYVGSTGNSTAPHLHLEFTKNGTRVNALSYFSGINFIYRD